MSHKKIMLVFITKPWIFGIINTIILLSVNILLSMPMTTSDIISNTKELPVMTTIVQEEPESNQIQEDTSVNTVEDKNLFQKYKTAFIIGGIIILALGVGYIIYSSTSSESLDLVMDPSTTKMPLTPNNMVTVYNLFVTQLNLAPTNHNSSVEVLNWIKNCASLNAWAHNQPTEAINVLHKSLDWKALSTLNYVSHLQTGIIMLRKSFPSTQDAYKAYWECIGDVLDTIPPKELVF